MENKIYIGSGKAIETQYGQLMKLSFTQDDLEKMQQNLSAGWVNLVLKERREPSEKGVTHYMVVDKWKPTRNEETGTTNFRQPDLNPDDLPF